MEKCLLHGVRRNQFKNTFCTSMKYGHQDFKITPVRPSYILKCNLQASNQLIKFAMILKLVPQDDDTIFFIYQFAEDAALINTPVKVSVSNYPIFTITPTSELSDEFHGELVVRGSKCLPNFAPQTGKSANL